MALVVKAAIAMHWFGVQYAADDVIDTTGYDDRAMTQLLTTQPVYVSDTSGGSTTPSGLVATLGGTLVSGTGAVLSMTLENDYGTSDVAIASGDATTLVINTAGLYTVTPEVDFPADPTGLRQLSVLLTSADPVTTNILPTSSCPATPTAGTSVTAPFTAWFAAGDTLQFWAKQVSGSSQSAGGNVLIVRLA